MSYNIQGRFMGIPYDWRIPTWRKIARRIYRPGGPVLVPKVWGLGWTLNFANAKTWWLIGGGLLLALVLSWTA